MRISIFILFFLCFSGFLIADNISNQKFIDSSFSGFYNRPEVKAFLDMDSALVVYTNKNKGYSIITNFIKQKNQNSLFLETFKDSTKKQRLLIVYNEPTIFEFQKDSLNADLVYRSINLKFNYQFVVSGKVSDVFIYAFQNSDTLNLKEVEKISTPSKTETSKLAEQSTFEKYFQPILLFSTSLAVILLLFFVRSN